MKIHYVTKNNAVIAELSGELDEHSAVSVRESLDTLLQDLTNNHFVEVIFDFSKVGFMDSTGIGVLLGRYNKFKNYPISFYIKNPSMHIDKILSMTGIYQIIPKLVG